MHTHIACLFHTGIDYGAYIRKNILPMKPSHILALLPAFLFLFQMTALSQCPTCTPDPSCVSADGMPSICPLVPPDAVAGEYYEQTLTFYLPATFIYPGSDVEITVNSVTVTSVSGLPYGLDFTLNDADGTLYPANGETLGCATICGIPLLPGTYDMLITVNAEITVLGITGPQVQSFPSSFTVVPGEGNSGSFAYDNLAGCGELDVNYEALLSVPEPSITSYSWDFGNGQSSTLSNPPTINYTAPGDYTVSLTTTISDHYITSVTATSFSSAWGNDEDLLSSPGDPYFILSDADGNAVYSSDIIDNASNASWEFPAILMSNPPYTITFYDDDLITDDDMLGFAFVNLEAGVIPFSSGNGTNGSINVNLEVSNEISDSTTVSVFPLPNADYTVDGNVLTVNNDPGGIIQWSLNGIVMEDEFGSSIEMTEGGQYSLTVSNEFGCTSTSSSYLYCPEITVLYDQLAGELYVPDIYTSYEWYYNGLPLDGGSTYYIPASASGNYSVSVTTDYGCETNSEVYILEIGIDEFAKNQDIVFPNPAIDILNFRSGQASNSGVDIIITDASGRICHSEKRNTTPLGWQSVDVSALSPGLYTLSNGNTHIRFIKK